MKKLHALFLAALLCCGQASAEDEPEVIRPVTAAYTIRRWHHSYRRHIPFAYKIFRMEQLPALRAYAGDEIQSRQMGDAARDLRQRAARPQLRRKLGNVVCRSRFLLGHDAPMASCTRTYSRDRWRSRSRPGSLVLDPQRQQSRFGKSRRDYRSYRLRRLQYENRTPAGDILLAAVATGCRELSSRPITASSTTRYISATTTASLTAPGGATTSGSTTHLPPTCISEPHHSDLATAAQCFPQKSTIWCRATSPTAP